MKKWLKITLISVSGFLFLVGGAALTLFCLRDETLTKSEFVIKSPKLSKERTLVAISDIHNHPLDFDKGTNLISSLNEIEMDALFLLGDVVDEDSDLKAFENLESVLKAMKEKDVKMVYTSGNHEPVMGEWRNDRLEMLLNGYGVEHSYGDVYHLDSEIDIHLLRDPYFYDWAKHSQQEEKEYVEKQLDRLDASFDKSKYNIMLSHRPSWFPLIEKHGYDLTFSGHMHGGQIKIGNWHVGAFGIPYPSYIEGMYQLNQSSMIVSRGLGNSPKIPLRVNCNPEIVVAKVGGSV